MSGPMKRNHRPGKISRPAHLLLQCTVFCVFLVLARVATAAIPAVGDTAPEFSLMTPTGAVVHLRDELRKGTVVLVVLRGYPGYQCPYCTRQVHDFIDHAPAFAADKAEVLLVYPGAPADLDQHAQEFLAQQQAGLPSNVVLVTDPDYKMTNAYDLRWEGAHETAYPSTFILRHEGKISYEKVSHSHGDRTSAEDILHQLGAQ